MRLSSVKERRRREHQWPTSQCCQMYRGARRRRALAIWAARGEAENNSCSVSGVPAHIYSFYLSRPRSRALFSFFTVALLASHPIKTVPSWPPESVSSCLSSSRLHSLPHPLEDLSLLIILTIPLHTRLVSSIFNLGFSRAISYTQHAEANWFKEAGFACWCWWV